MGVIAGEYRDRIQIIGVGEADQQAIVAVPDSAWHRTKSRRRLAADALLRAVRVDCQASSGLDRQTLDPNFGIKLWLGVLRPDYVDMVLYGQEATAAITFPVDSLGLSRLPAAEALQAVAQDHFTFLSAESGTANPGEQKVEARLQRLEGSLDDVLQTLKEMAGKKQPRPPMPVQAAPKRQSAIRQPSSTALAMPPGLGRRTCRTTGRWEGVSCRV